MVQLPESSYGDRTVSSERTPNRRRRLAYLGAGLSVLASTLLVTAPGAAASGLWGAGDYPYVAGQVCTTGPLSAPLTSWDVGGAGPGYLVAPLTSNGVQDSGAPPLSSAGVQQQTSVTPGTDGFTSDADIGAYAALLAGVGTTGSDQQVAEVAGLVMTHAGASGAPSCGGDGSALLRQAAATAGPYTVTVSPPSTPAVLGTPATVVATVHGGQGQPVAGLTVSFNADGATLTNATVVTDASGRAGTTITVPTSSPAASAEVTASVQGVVGLQQVTVTATPSATNPSGASVAAIAPTPATTVTASAAIPIDQTASPVLTAGGSVPAVAIGGSLHPTATVTGMRGHSGTLAFTIYGPARADSAGNCDGVRLSSSAPVAATTDVVPLVGDQTVTASTWTPTTAGCYAVQAGLQTTNATPAVKAVSDVAAPAALVTVLPVTAQVTPAHTLVGQGPQQATLAIHEAGGAAGSVQASLLGPLPPTSSGSCAGRDWSNAATVRTVQATSHGDGTIPLATGPVTSAGCYAWTATVGLTFGDGQVPVAAAPATVLLITPSVSLTSDQIWSVSPNPVGTHVTVIGTYGLPAHVAVRMAYAPDPLTGCRAADWAHAPLLSTGPSVAVRGSSAAVPSGATPKYGCYQPVPHLTMDANPAITASGPSVVDGNAVAAGVDTAVVSSARTPTVHSGLGAGLWVVGGILLAAELAAVIGTAVVARRDEPQPSSLPLTGLE